MSDYLESFDSIYDAGPSTYDLRIARGDYVEIPMLIYSGGVLLSLTGYIFYARFSRDLVDLPFTVVPAPNQTQNRGQLSIILESAVTADLSGTYAWYLDWVDPQTHRRSLIEGTMTVVE
jgi:hypothetical protein